jgi:hypothetical protein
MMTSTQVIIKTNTEKKQPTKQRNVKPLIRLNKIVIKMNNVTVSGLRWG